MSIEVLSAIIASVVAIVAIIAPIITTYINSKHQENLQKFSFAANKRLALYEEFLSVMDATFAQDRISSDLSLQFKQIFSKTYLICSDNTKLLLDQLNDYLYDHAHENLCSNDEYRKLRFFITNSMHNDLKKLR